MAATTHDPDRPYQQRGTRLTRQLAAEAVAIAGTREDGELYLRRSPSWNSASTHMASLKRSTIFAPFLGRIRFTSRRLAPDVVGVILVVEA